MNKEFTFINGVAYVSDGKSLLDKEIPYYDNLNEVLRVENQIEINNNEIKEYNEVLEQLSDTSINDKKCNLYYAVPVGLAFVILLSALGTYVFDKETFYRLYDSTVCTRFDFEIPRVFAQLFTVEAFAVPFFSIMGIASSVLGEKESAQLSEVRQKITELKLNNMDLCAKVKLLNSNKNISEGKYEDFDVIDVDSGEVIKNVSRVLKPINK